MTSPLKPDGSNFPCKNYHEDFDKSPAGDPTATWAAGSSQKVTFGGSATHEGGSCQLSMSFDGGKTFKVIKSIEGSCVPLQGGGSLDFTVPADTKNGKAIFAWTWFNHTGNREMYMNCAAVTITGTGTSTLNDRPEIFKANINNGCETDEKTDVKFPDPGPDVEVLSSESLAAPKCENQAQPDESDDPTTPTEPTEPTKSAAESTTDSNSSESSTSADSDYSTSSARLADPTPVESTPVEPTPVESTPVESTDEEPVATRSSSVSAPTATPTGALGPTYTVKAGDICMNIAKQQDIPLATLYSLNPDMYVYHHQNPG
jgi:LysM repeat protein